jgi:hypothetical protein
LKDYRIAGEEHRLDLFLAYRDLRDQFRKIEREESSATAGIYAVFPGLDPMRSGCPATPGILKKFKNVPLL